WTYCELIRRVWWKIQYSRGERCHGLRHLENGRTFFRYGGLYVTFTCNPGFRVHGFRTSSCISGRWTRAPPACVASGCPNPGGILHGSSMMTPDRSFVFFMCDKGYRLFGCPLLYCRGRTWNSTKPVCKESDVMSSDKQKLLALLRSSLAQNLNAPSALKNLFQLQYDSSLSAASKDIFLDPGLLAEEPRASMFFTEPFTIASQTVEEQQAQHSIYSKTHEATVTSESVTNSLSSASTRRPQLPASPKARIIDSTASQELNRPSFELSSTTSDQIPLLDSSVSATLYHVTNTPDTSEDSLRTPSFPQAQSSVLDSFNTSLVFKGNIAKSGSINKDHAKFSESLASPQNSTASTFLVGESYSRYSGSAPHQIRSEMSPDASFSDMNQKTPLKHPEKNNQGHLERTIIFSSDEIKTNVTFQDNTEHSTRAGKKNNKPTTASSATADELPLLGSLKRRPVCPYPPLPPHGTFYFRTAVNPSPWQYRHYVQYSCYPGYTLANGDVYSYCLHNGRWSGVTPACLEVTPCSVNNGGCSQLCEVTPEGRAQCNCRDGFELLQDNRTCRDVNECAEELHYCQQDCINTFGFYKCSCWPGYLLSEDERSCSDVDECQLPIGFASCLFGCINTPGSFRCHCPEGYRMAAVEGHCIDIDECQEPGPRQRRCEWRCVNLPGSHRCMCPRGYRLDPDAYHCQDINECNSKNGGCSHICINYKGGFQCACPEHYRFAPYSRKKCQPIQQHLRPA
uniref:Si:dkey-163f14.6 n=1 Tax=Lepisosteus oculatus TaxID=7918 RepID=W5ML36_LEPOC